MLPPPPERTTEHNQYSCLKYYNPALQETLHTTASVHIQAEKLRTACTTLLRACSCALFLGGRSSLSYLSCDLCGGDGSSHGGGSGQSTRRRWCEKGHGWRHGFAHAQVLTTQVEQVHGGDGVLGRLSLLILCTQEMSRPPSEVPPTSHRAPP